MRTVNEAFLGSLLTAAAIGAASGQAAAPASAPASAAAPMTAASRQMPTRNPAVIAEASTDALVMTEESFGPVAAVRTVADDREALQLANALPFGLAAYLYTGDLERGWAMAEAIEARLRTGRPLAPDEWISRHEADLGRPLAPQKRGPKPKLKDASA